MDAAGMTIIADELRRYAELAEGHRKHLLELGWDPGAAQAIAVQIHANFITTAFDTAKRVNQ